MKITFRVDASLEMGTGHVMRCLTFANALKEQGTECHFICREHPGNLIPQLTQQGHKVHTLAYSTAATAPANTEHPLAHAAWLGSSQATDADLCQAIIETTQPDWLIVDHYALDIQWEKALRPYCKKLMVIDDLADRQHDCDLLLDQTFGRAPKDYLPLVPQDCQLLCGSEYALLRPEFAQWRDYSLKRREQGQLEHLLINLGGVDKNNITSQILKALANSPLPKNCHITVVMGATAPWVEEVKHQAAQLPWPTQVKVGVSNMAELMANSDLAIGAAGATSWERCCLGLPTIMVVLADNQKLIAKGLQAVGAALFLDKQHINDNELTRSVAVLTSSPSKVLGMSNSAAKVSDGRGVELILQQMEL